MRELRGQIATAVQEIQSRSSLRPRLGLILGTGLGGLAEQIVDKTVIPYESIPHFPHSTVESHAGQLALGLLSGVPVAAMEGRFHYYEGYSLQQVTFPVRVMKALGADTLLVTNAAGGMNHQFALADLMIIEDHIHLIPDNPLRGPNDEELGPRFPDMSRPYDRELIALAERTALELGIPAKKGVFVSVPGPNLETRAEYRWLRGMGADCVGMSTTPEVIVAVHSGMKALGFSVVTDMCLPDALEPADIQKIIAVAKTGGERLALLIPKIVEQLG